METNFQSVLLAEAIAKERVRDAHKERVKLERVGLATDLWRGLTHLLRR